MKAEDVRSIESRFVELLASAPGTKEEKQDFFRVQLKLTIARPNYETMWERLVESLGRVGAAEAVFDYVIASAVDRLKELLLSAQRDDRVRLREREPSITRHIFYENGHLRPLGQRLRDYLDSDDRRWDLFRDTSIHERSGEEPEEAYDESNAPSGGFEYDVALSFAGEQRSYVEEVAKTLDRNSISHFYDAHEVTRMWGKDLASFLDVIFRKKARYCVMFLSRDYVAKIWPLFEGRAAIARAVIERHREYVLPVRFDNAEFPGLSPTIKYLDARKLMPVQIAQHILEKVKRRDITGTSRPSEADNEGVIGVNDAEAGIAKRGATTTTRQLPHTASPPEGLEVAKTGDGFWGSPRLQEYEEQLKAALYQAVQESNVENSRRKLVGEPPLPDDWLDNRIQTLRNEVHKRYPPWIEAAAPTEEDRLIAERDRKVRALHLEGLSGRKIAKQLGVPPRVVRKILRPDEESFSGGGL